MDRREVLDGWSKSRKILNHPLLPQHIKDKAKIAMDAADAILSLQDAQRRKLTGPSPASARDKRSAGHGIAEIAWPGYNWLTEKSATSAKQGGSDALGPNRRWRPRLADRPT